MQPELLYLIVATAVIFGAVAIATQVVLRVRLSISPREDRPYPEPDGPSTMALGTSLITAAAGGAVALAATGLPAMAAIGAWAGWAMPREWISRYQATRVRRIERQLIDLVRDLNTCLSNGMSLTEAVDYASRRAPTPLGRELGLITAGIRSGGSTAAMFASMAHRLGCRTAQRLADAVRLGVRYGRPFGQTLRALEGQSLERLARLESRQRITRRARLRSERLSVVVPALIALYLGGPGAETLVFYNGLAGTSVLVACAGVIILARGMTTRLVEGFSETLCHE